MRRAGCPAPARATCSRCGARLCVAHLCLRGFLPAPSPALRLARFAPPAGPITSVAGLSYALARMAEAGYGMAAADGAAATISEGIVARQGGDGARVAREISYASAAETRGGRLVIRAIENSTGRLGLIRRARGYEREIATGSSFWQVMCRRYGLSLELTAGSLADIPANGPLVVIANHPFGILDGLMMGHLLDRARGDFRILANSVFRRARELDEVVLPIDFGTDKAALKLNLETRARALDYLAQGGAVGVFPGGTVSTAARPFGRPLDPGWRQFTAKMIARSGATVVPVFFEGHNSRLFQLVSHLHPTLRLALLIKEFRARIDGHVRVALGRPIAAAELARFRGDPRAMMDFLRHETYALSGRPVPARDYGYDFEDSRQTG